MDELSDGTVKYNITQDLPTPEAKVAYFYTSFPGESQPKIAFTVNGGEIVPSFTFEFRLGILLRNIDGELRVTIDMGDGNFFADYKITPEKLLLADGWSATELLIRTHCGWPSILITTLPQRQTTITFLRLTTCNCFSSRHHILMVDWTVTLT